MINALKKFFLKDLVLEIKDIRSLELLKNIHSGYLPWTGASIHPTALLYLLNDITIHKRNHIVECGSGISTIYIASLIRNLKRDITFQTIDHNDHWLSIMRDHLEEHDLLEYVDLIHAPLKHCQHCRDESYEWYDSSILNERIIDKPIDMLFVDGPPAKQRTCDLSRYPALSYFHSKLAEEYIVLLDDSCRKGEQKTAKFWKDEFGLSFKQEILKGDVLIAKNGGPYTVL
jgi:predicted O-methyltransferase YrrM